MGMKALTLAAAVLLSGGSPDDHGGKVAWVRDAQFGLARAKLEGRPAMLFFAADFCGMCKQLGSSAFSDEKVVAAAQKIIPIYVNSTRKGDNQDLRTRYKVQAYPAVLYVDPDGVLIREMDNRDAAGIVRDIDLVTAKVSTKATIWSVSIAAAREAGKKARKPVAVVSVDPKADLAKLNARLTKDLGERKTKFFWVLEPGPESAIRVLDPASEETLVRIPLKDDDKPEALNKALDDAAKLLKK
jgi:hypothetical protein